MPRAVRLALTVLILAVITPPATAQASTLARPTPPPVPAAGHLQATPLPARQANAAPGKEEKGEKPFHTVNPEALKQAKKKAEDAARKSGTGAPRAPSGSGSAAVVNGLNKAGLQASDEGNTATPPDPTGAIGPANYIEMVNQLVGVYDRNTLALISSTSFANFAHVPSGMATSDPQIEWDPVANRWLYAMVGIQTGNNFLLFGWTKTASPTDLTGGWCTFGVSTGTHLQDYPKLGHDASWVVVGANAYSDVNGRFPFETAQIWAFPKPAASDSTCSSPVNATFFADATHPLKNADGSLAFTPVPANTTDSGNDYIVGSRDVSVRPASKLMVWHMEARPAPTLVPDGDVTVGTYSIPPGVPQPGSSFLIDSLDGRNTQAVGRFDPSAGAEALWTQHTIAGAGGPSAVRWYELLPATLTIRQEGSLSSASDYYWNAAISPSSAGNDAMIEYNRGSSSQLALIGAQTRSSSTPLGQMDSGETVIATSTNLIAENGFQGNCSPNPCRWGDYSGATPDLSNSHVVWGSNEMVGPPFSGFAQWQTQNFAVSTVPPAPDFALSASPTSQNIVPGSSTSYTINVTRVSGFAGAVTLSVAGLPAGAAGSFSPNPATASTSTLTVTTSASTAFGTYSLILTGTSGSLTHTTSATLVLSPPPPCSSASLAPASTTQPIGTAILFTASSTGCANPVYEYWVQMLNGTWTMTRAFSSDATWTWNTAGLSPGTFTVHVWANQAGDQTTTFEAFGSSTVTLTGCATASLAPGTASGPVGSTIHFTATSTGCANPQYEFWVQYLDGSWNMLRAFSTTATWDWTSAGLAPGSYSVHVWANNVGDSTAALEAFGSSTVTLTGCSTASLSPSSASATQGSIVHFVASSTGCASPQYEYWVQYLDGSWHMLRAFSSDRTWDWNTAGLPGGTYTVHVWANNAGDSTAAFEAFGSSTVTLAGACTSASLAPPSTTQPVGTAIQFTASSAGCPNPQYEYWVQYLDGSWNMLRAFSADPTWTWNSAGLAPGTYTVHVWANQTGDSTATWEAFGSSTVTLTGCASASITPPSASAPAGSTVHLVAGSTGCANPQYEYWVQYLDGTWHMLRAFSTTAAWDWNSSGLAPGVYTVHVWANNVGDSTAAFEAFGSSTITLTGCTSAALTASSSSVAGGSSVTFTASSAGCPNPVYEFWLQDTTGTWQMVQAFSTSNTWVFNTTGAAKGTYNVHVWANQQGADTSTYETFGSASLTVT